ncbi:MAG: hypothetical protein DI535_16925 [Citrobacter freundii]|nr:MAG: hypothetical protein DI535_16925 [Citrobacter freundii]
MKILLFSDQHNFGGAEIYLAHLAESLQQFGNYDVLIVCSDKNQRLIEMCRQRKLDHRPLRIRNRADYKLSMLISFADIVQVRRLVKLLKAESPSIVLINQPTCEEAHNAVLATRICKIKRAVIRHISRPVSELGHSIKFPRIRQAWVNMIDNMLNGLIFVSGANLKTYEAQKRKSINLFVVHFGMNDNMQDLQHRTLQDGIKTVACIGRLDNDQKRQADLLQAISLLKGRLRADYKFVGDGKDMDDLKNTAASLDIEESVQFTGWISDAIKKKELYNSLSLIVMPSAYEGLPLVMIEAFSFGIPVVATRIDGFTDFIDGTNGALVNVGDTTALANAIADSLADRQHYVSLSANAHRTFMSHFNSQKMFGSINDALEILLKDQKVNKAEQVI